MRKPRIKPAGATFVIFTKTLAGMKCFESEAMKQEVIRCLQKAYERFGILVLEFTILDDSVRMVVTTNLGQDISIFMQFFKMLVTIAYNKQVHRVGTIWHGRFESEVLRSIDEIEQTMGIVRAHAENKDGKKICINPYSSVGVRGHEVPDFYDGLSSEKFYWVKTKTWIFYSDESSLSFKRGLQRELKV